MLPIETLLNTVKTNNRLVGTAPVQPQATPAPMPTNDDPVAGESDFAEAAAAFVKAVMDPEQSQATADQLSPGQPQSGAPASLPVPLESLRPPVVPEADPGFSVDPELVRAAFRTLKG